MSIREENIDILEGGKELVSISVAAIDMKAGGAPDISLRKMYQVDQERTS